MSDAAVLIVGAGPTGLACAHLLGTLGVPALVVEREAGVADEPRAVSVDDEALRLLQAVGLDAAARAVVQPGTGTRYYGSRGQLLARTPGVAVPRYGHPPKSPMDHGELLRFLLGELAQRDTVRTRFSTTLTALEVDGGRATATVRGLDGREERLAPRFVLACDGGRSTVRKQLGVPMEGSSLDEPWLVIDTIDDPHRERYAMHHGDPRRPHVVLPGAGGRCRYEFLLHPHEDPDAATSFAMAQRLLAAHRPALRPEDVVRQRVYVFHALVARRWRQGPVFLLGDAAHMMPPFAGQGLNTGLRDALNLCWKLAAVLRGQAGDRLLDSYEAERSPHARAMIDLSVRRGRTVMTTSRARAATRDAVVGALRAVPAARRRLERVRVKPEPAYAAGLRVGDADAVPAVGRMLPQPRVLHGDGRVERLDDVLGPWFALVAAEPALLERLRSPRWDALGARRVSVDVDERFPPAGGPKALAVGDLDGLLASAFGGSREHVLLVRPDRYVAGAFRPADEERFLERWAAATDAPAAPPRPASVPAPPTDPVIRSTT